MVEIEGRRARGVTPCCFATDFWPPGSLAGSMTATKMRKQSVLMTPTKKRTMLVLRNEGYKLDSIASMLNSTKGTISKNLRKLALNPDPYAHVSRPGRPPLLSAQDKRRLRGAILSGDQPDASAAHCAIRPPGGVHTTRCALSQMGLPGRRRRTVAALDRKQVARRKKWSITHRYWSPEKWRSVWFSDECKINLWGSDGLTWCRRGPKDAFHPRNVKPKKQQGGGGIMVWSFITPDGVGPLIRVKGKINAHKYIRVLSEHLVPILPHNSNIIFQQDGAPAHRAKATQRYLISKKCNILPWPPSSPNMSIIEHAWPILKRLIKARPRHPRNEEELWVAAQEEWLKVTRAEIENLYDSIPDRVEALYQAKGWYTRY